MVYDTSVGRSREMEIVGEINDSLIRRTEGNEFSLATPHFP
jgi:hypothetical protein